MLEEGRVCGAGRWSPGSDKVSHPNNAKCCCVLVVLVGYCNLTEIFFPFCAFMNELPFNHLFLLENECLDPARPEETTLFKPAFAKSSGSTSSWLLMVATILSAAGM